jgi:hypothetical protein
MSLSALWTKLTGADLSDASPPQMHRFYQRYRLVAAAPIVSVDGNSVTVSVDGVERTIGVPPEFFNPGTPAVGDYLVAYPDPGTSVLWEKKDNFEASYTLEGTGPEGPPGDPGPQGPEGPTAVSADAGNIAVLGSDSFLLVPNTATFVGVTDGSDAADGFIGQYLTADNTTGVSMAANVAASVCTLPLPPGCWEVWGACGFLVAGAEGQATPIQPNQLGASISVTPDSLPTDEELILGTGVMNLIYSPLAAGQRQVLITGQCRSNSTEPVDLFLVAQIGLGDATVKGYLCGRRVR